MEGSGGQRALAAIVFTDVAGFSRVAERDEPLAHRLLKRDFALMEKIATDHHGRIANSMGDGLLLVFPSAVDAMEAGLEIQRRLHEQAERVGPAETLLHRMGIHMGDVMLDGTNVFGDGVNVAARLEREAKPGGIAYSRVVHDLVKNKLTFPTQYLGPRALKNIEERVMVWAVLPVGERALAAAEPVVESVPMLPSDGVGGGKGIALIGVSLALVAATAAGVLLLPKIAPRPAPAREAPAPATRPVEAPKPTPEPETPAAPAVSDGVLEKLSKARAEYDFAAVVAGLQAAYPNPDATQAELIQRYTELGQMRTWLESKFASATQERPIVATLDIGSGIRQYQVYGSADGIEFDAGVGTYSRKLAELPPAVLAELGSVLAGAADAPPNARTWLAEFRNEYAN